MTQNKYKILVKLVNETNEIYLPNDYEFSIQQVSKIKKYLPKSLSFIGVDAKFIEQNDQQDLKQERIKLKAIGGVESQTKKEIKFWKPTDLVNFSQKVTLCLDLPFNPRQESQDSQLELETRLEHYFDHYLNFKSKITGKILQNESKEKISLNEIEVFFNPFQYEPSLLENQIRSLRFQLAFNLILQKANRYQLSQILSLVKLDLLQSIKIMIKNKMSIRLVSISDIDNRYFCLQSFINEDNIILKEKQVSKLESLTKKAKVVEKQYQIEQQKQNEEMKQKQKQQNHTRFPLVMLVILVILYLYLKVNPLDKLIQESSQL